MRPDNSCSGIRPSVLLTVCLACVFVDTLAAVGQVTQPFRNITDNSAFRTLYAPVLNDSGTVAFFALGYGTNPGGIYTGSGGPVTTVADRSTFNTFGDGPYISNNGSVAFVATPYTSGANAYVASGGSLTPANLPANSEATTVGISGNGVLAFATRRFDSSADDSYVDRLFVGGAEVANDSGGLATFGPIVINDNGAVAYRGFLDNGDTGIYVIKGGSTATVADNVGGFTFAARPPTLNSGGTVAFNGTRNGKVGIFTGSGGPVATVIDATGPFTSVSAQSLNSAGVVVFNGKLANGASGIFTGPNPVTDRVIGSGDSLFGSTVTSVTSSEAGINSRGDIAFTYGLENGTTGIAVAEAGFRQNQPLLPVVQRPGVFSFYDAPSGRWVDPPATDGFQYKVTSSDSLFTSILDFPTGFDGKFKVTAGDQVLGTFGPGEYVNFVALLGTGVSEFVVSGIQPQVDGADPRAFPLRVEFSTPTASFDLIAIPEPTGLAALLFSVLLGARRQRGRSF